MVDMDGGMGTLLPRVGTMLMAKSLQCCNEGGITKVYCFHVMANNSCHLVVHKYRCNTPCIHMGILVVKCIAN